MKKIVTILILLFCLINSRGITASTATVYVMHAPYAFVIAKNCTSDFSAWGGINKWNKIILWGRCPESYYTDNYEYKWTYGHDDEETGWRSIDAFDGDFDSSYKYLKADSHQYKTKAGEPITYYTANLIIRNDMAVVLSTTPVLVKAVDFSEVTNANGFNDPAEAKRLMMESMAKGRGLKWLYINQKTDGSWIGSYYEDYEDGLRTAMAETGLALAAFLVHGHSVYDPHGTVDIFVKTVNDGLDYIFSNATLIAVPTTGEPSDINSNGNMIRLDTDDGWSNYTHGICMLALAASYNHVRAASNVTVSGVTMPYAEAVGDVVDWAAWSQDDAPSESEGGWDYEPNLNRNRNDQSCAQWPALGLAAIEDVWGFKAPDFVRNKMVNNLLRRIQYQNAGVGDDEDGRSIYCQYHSSETFYSTVATFTAPVGYGVSHRMVGTSALLQELFYVSLDTTTAITACQCDSDAANYCGIGHEDRDCTINKENISFSCERVKHAIDWIGRHWTVPIPGHGTYYGMYGVMKAFRLYNYEKGGINDGLIYDGTNFTAPPSGGTHQWEDEYSDYVLNDQKSDGHWDRWVGTVLSTSWALLMLAETVYYPSSIKTELLENMIQYARVDNAKIKNQNAK